MKSFILLSAILICTSCSTEEMPEQTILQTKQGPRAAKKLLLPQNAANPYDAVGAVYGLLADEILDTPHNADLADVLAICHDEPLFGTLFMQEYVPLSEIDLENLHTAAVDNFSGFCTTIGLSGSGTTKFQDYVDGLSNLKSSDADYAAFHAYSVAYEASVTSSALSASDKEILLCTTSILRYGYYSESRKRRRDRDWTLSIGHVALTAYGASLTHANAIVSSLGGRFVFIR